MFQHSSHACRPTAYNVVEACVTYVAATRGCLMQHGARGYDKVEEYDPIERMKRLATGPAVDSMPSLEDELKSIKSAVDIHNFTYKPVPRTDDEDEE